VGDVIRSYGYGNTGGFFNPTLISINPITVPSITIEYLG
jgi:hypothetical protein